MNRKTKEIELCPYHLLGNYYALGLNAHFKQKTNEIYNNWLIHDVSESLEKNQIEHTKILSNMIKSPGIQMWKRLISRVGWNTLTQCINRNSRCNRF